MRVLAIGGAGYLGSVLTRRLVEKKIEVLIFDDLSTGLRTNVGNIEFVEGDAGRFEDLKTVFERNTFQQVIFLIPPVVSSDYLNPYLTFRSVLLPLLNTLECMRLSGVKKIIYASSSEVYGRPDFNPVDENSKLNILSPHSEVLNMNERLLGWFDVTFGIKGVSLRVTDVAGAGFGSNLGDGKETPSSVNAIAKASVSGLPYKIEGDNYDTLDGTVVRDIVHIEDAAEAFVCALDYLSRHPVSEIFNISQARGFSINDILDEVANQTGKAVLVTAQPKKRFDPEVIWMDNSKARSMLSWEPRFGLSDMVQTALLYYAKSKN